MKVGIESIDFYTSHYYLDLQHIADERNIPVSKYYEGIGQEKMATPPPDEDVVTLAANAASKALEGVDSQKIDTIMFATESGIDQSKAAGVYVHHLLDLNKNCRVFELKQACYSGAAAIQMAVPYIIAKPQSKVLIVAADIARYGLGTAGEPTQGAGAVAMVLSADPRILSFHKESGLYTEDVMDFWRPNYRDEALVDGKFSIKMYIKALTESWDQYSELSKRTLTDFDYFCYHLPFTRMGEKAHFHLVKSTGDHSLTDEEIRDQIIDSFVYNRIVGNTYTASLFLGLVSLLENSARDISGKKVGLFSYGSGCVGEFFSGEILPGYQKYIHGGENKRFLDERRALSYEEYKSFYTAFLRDGQDIEIEKHRTGLFRFAGARDQKRIYQRLM